MKGFNHSVRRRLSKQTTQKVYQACRVAGRWALRATAFGAAFMTGLTIVLFTMLNGDGISLGILRPAIEKIVANKTGAESVSVGKLTLVRDPNEEIPLQIKIQDIRLNQDGGTDVVIPGMILRLDSGALLRGQAMPRFIEVTGAEISVERRGDGVSLGGTTGDGAPLDMGAMVAQARDAGFEGAKLSDLRLTYKNYVNGASFTAQNSSASLSAEGDGYVFRLTVPYEDQSDAPGELYLDVISDADVGEVELTLSAVNVPAGVIMPLFFGGNDGVVLDAPVSGTLTAKGKFATGLSEIGLALFVDKGIMSLGGKEISLDFLTIDGMFYPLSHKLSLSRLEYDISGNKAIAEGEAELVFLDGTLDTVPFDLVAREVVANPDNMLPEPLLMSDARVQGRFNMINRALEIDALDADYFNARIRGKAIYSLPEETGQSAGLKADLFIEGTITPAQVLRGWPVAVGDGARRWVSANLIAGQLKNVAYTMDIPRGHFSSGGVVSDDFLDLTFDAENAEITYVPGMTPITGLSAYGRVRGNSFYLDAENGQIGSVRVVRGGVRMEKFVPKGEMGVFSASVEGALPELLTILDENPLGYVTKAGFDPKDFVGTGTFDITVERPLLSSVPLKDYNIYGSGTFADLELSSIGPGLGVEGGTGTIELRKTGLAIAGDITVEGVPTTFEWDRRFGSTGPMTLSASTSIDGRTADALGLPLRRFMRGEILATLEAKGAFGKFHRAIFKADLTDAVLLGEKLEPIKQAGEAGQARLVVNMSGSDQMIDLETITWQTAAMNIEGSAKIDPDLGLVFLDLPRFFIQNYADLSAKLERKEGTFNVLIDGEYAYLGGLISSLMSEDDKAGAFKGDMNIEANLRAADLRGTVSLEDIALTARYDGQQIAALAMEGLFYNGGGLAIDIERKNASVGRQIRLETDRFGQILEGVFGISSVLGGDAIFTATAIDDGAIVGTLDAKNIVVQNAPTVTRLLSVGSLDGLADVMNGVGLSFDELSGDIQFDAGVLRFVDARATGTALGVSANGDIDLRNGVFSLHGAVAPAYQVNSFFGALPGLGELLVSRKGEGIFAFAYRVEGPTTAPTITVNTFAALTPGIFRRVFEPVMRNATSTDDLLSAAEAAADMSEAMDYLATPELLREHELWQEGKNQGLIQLPRSP